MDKVGNMGTVDSMDTLRKGVDLMQQWKLKEVKVFGIDNLDNEDDRSVHLFACALAAHCFPGHELKR